MKKINLCMILMFLTIFIINPSSGFPGMQANNSVEQSDNLTQPDLNATSSDQDIVMVQHLIELDALQLQAENKLLVKETLIFRNLGTSNFSGDLRTWLPDGAEGVRLEKSEMMTGGGALSLPNVTNGNIISWSDSIEKNSRLPFLYVIEYTMGTGSKQIFSKKLAYPTLINYRYMQREDLPAMVIKVTKPQDSNIAFTDENGNKIVPQDVSEEGSSTLNRFFSPTFKEITIEISKPAIASGALAGYLVYAVLGLLILLVLSYPVMRKKSEKLQRIEEKIKNSLKREPEQEEIESEEIEEEIPEETEEEITPEEEIEKEDLELSGKTKDELEIEKRMLTSKLEELEKKYTSGDLMDEEYEDLRESYRGKLEKIQKSLGKPD